MSEGLASLSRIEGTGMITIRADLAAVATAGISVPNRGEWIEQEGRVTAWMSMDELLVLVDRGETAKAEEDLRNALSETHSLVADVSDARAQFRLSGARWRDVLSKLTPADLHPSALGERDMRRTRLAQVPAALWISGPNTVDVICFRSVADYVADLLTGATLAGSFPQTAS